MKKIFNWAKSLSPLLLIALTLTAFGCQKFGGGTPKITAPDGWKTFNSIEYSFSIAYPENMEVQDRLADKQDTTYLNLSGKFFASLRDVKREDGVSSIALFYSFKDLSFDKFSEALVASDTTNVSIKETTDVTQGGIAMKKIVSTTALGADKIHYLFKSGDNLIVASVIIGEEEAFAPEFATMQIVAE